MNEIVLFHIPEVFEDIRPIPWMTTKDSKGCAYFFMHEEDVWKYYTFASIVAKKNRPKYT